MNLGEVTLWSGKYLVKLNKHYLPENNGQNHLGCAGMHTNQLHCRSDLGRFKRAQTLLQLF